MKFKAAEWFIASFGQHPKRLLLVSVGILASGFSWHLISRLNDPDSKSIAFSRSGALLVMFAITAVFFNHILGKIRSNKEKHIEKYDKPTNVLESGFQRILSETTVAEVGQQVWDNTLKQNPNFVQEQAAKMADQMENHTKVAKEDLENLNTAEANIACTEACAGIVGTFVWGYGDIIFNLLYTIGIITTKIPPYISNLTDRLT